MMTNRRDGGSPLLRTALIAMFAALAYLATLIHIPYPAPVGTPFIHLGNIIPILAALLLGGWQGGLAGAIGMGLFDLSFGYTSTLLKTILLKFGIGLTTGLVASFGRRHPEKSPRAALGVCSAVSFAAGLLLLGGRLLGAADFLKIPAVAYLFLILLGAVLGLASFFAPRLRFMNNERLFALLGATAGIAFNAAGEFVGGVITKLLTGAVWQAAVVASVASLPATLINGTFSIMGALLLYLPLRQALRRAHLAHLVQ